MTRKRDPLPLRRERRRRPGEAPLIWSARVRSEDDSNADLRSIRGGTVTVADKERDFYLPTRRRGIAFFRTRDALGLLLTLPGRTRAVSPKVRETQKGRLGSTRGEELRG